MLTFDAEMKFYRSILSIGFIALVLFSSSNVMVGLHFCGNDVSVALFEKAQCGMEMKAPPCHQQQRSCCDDELVVHQAQDFKDTINEFQFQPQLIAELVPSIEISEIIAEASNRYELSVYHPPLRSADLTVSNQVFRI